MSEVQLVAVRNLTPDRIIIGPYLIPPNNDPVTGGIGEIPLVLAKSRLLSGERRFYIPPEVADIEIQSAEPAKEVPEQKPFEIPSLPGGLVPVEQEFDGKFFVILSGVSWGYTGQGQTPTEMSKAIAALGHRVLYVHMGNPEHDLDYQIPDGVQVFALAKIYGNDVNASLIDKKSRNEVGTRLVNSIRAVIHAWCGGRGEGRGFVLITNPLPAFSAIAYELRLRSKFKVVYQCFDDWSGFTQISKYSIENVEGIDFTEEELNYVKSEADYFVATSPALQKKLAVALKEFKGESDTTRVPIIRNGFVPESFPQEPGEIECPPGLVRGNPTIIYWGCLAGEWFNWDAVIRAAAAIPGAEINLIGVRPSDNLIANRTGGKKLPKNVHFIGFIPHDKLYTYGANSDIGIIPFRDGVVSEAVSPLKAYEYLACKLPVIAMGVPEVSEMPASFVAENLDEFVSAIQKTYEGLQTRKWPAKKVAKFLEESTWEKRAKALLDHISQ